MITRRSPEPSGLEANTPYYSFFGRLSRSECGLLTRAQEKAKKKLGGTPSNALLLVELLKSYVGEAAR